jgi:hypothetical protein
VVSTLTKRAYGSERDAALLMAEALPCTHRTTLGSDKGYDAHDFVAVPRHMRITPHIAQNDTNRRSVVDERTTHHAGYEVSQKERTRIEEVVGWMKSIGLLRKLRHRGLECIGWMCTDRLLAARQTDRQRLCGVVQGHVAGQTPGGALVRDLDGGQATHRGLATRIQ